MQHDDINRLNKMIKIVCSYSYIVLYFYSDHENYLYIQYYYKIN
jgi:hypothetical protein